MIGHIIVVVTRDGNKLTIWIANIKPWLVTVIYENWTCTHALQLNYRNMKSIKYSGKLIAKWRQFYYFKFS